MTGEEVILTLIDELITADGEPFEDAVSIIEHVLERALGPGRGGMGDSEAEILQSLKDELDTRLG